MDNDKIQQQHTRGRRFSFVCLLALEYQLACLLLYRRIVQSNRRHTRTPMLRCALPHYTTPHLAVHQPSIHPSIHPSNKQSADYNNNNNNGSTHSLSTHSLCHAHNHNHKETKTHPHANTTPHTHTHTRTRTHNSHKQSHVPSLLPVHHSTSSSTPPLLEPSNRNTAPPSHAHATLRLTYISVYATRSALHHSARLLGLTRLYSTALHYATLQLAPASRPTCFARPIVPPAVSSALRG